MNVQPLLYEFENSNNVAEVSKNISGAKGEYAADHSTITRLFKKVPSHNILILQKLFISS